MYPSVYLLIGSPFCHAVPRTPPDLPAGLHGQTTLPRPRASAAANVRVHLQDPRACGAAHLFNLAPDRRRTQLQERHGRRRVAGNPNPNPNPRCLLVPSHRVNLLISRPTDAGLSFKSGTAAGAWQVPPSFISHIYTGISSKGFALTWYRALTWYFLRLSPPRTHFKPWKAVGTRGRGSLAAR